MQSLRLDDHSTQQKSKVHATRPLDVRLGCGLPL